MTEGPNDSADWAVCEVAERGDLASVKWLQQLGADLRAHDDEPLCRAAGGGHLEVVRYIHQNGGDIAARNNEPLLRACAGGHLDIVVYLHQNGVALTAPDNEPLCRAAAGGHLEVVRYIHQSGGDFAARDNEPLCRAAGGGHLEVVRYIHQNGGDFAARDNEPLCRAAGGGHLEVVRYIHQNGGDFAARDNEPLCRAAGGGHLAVVRYIHQNGGDFAARDNEPLRRAAAGRHSALVEYLHNAGAAANLLTADSRHTIEQMKQELHDAPTVYHPSLFWKEMNDVNERVLEWSGEANFKRALNQNYFNFVPTGADDARMLRIRRLMRGFDLNVLERCVIEDPDCDPASWMSCYPGYFIFKLPDRSTKRELYRKYVALMFEYARQRDSSGLLEVLDEPELGNPIRVRRDGRLISQDLVNSIRERNYILAAMKAKTDAGFTLAELGAGYGRLGYVLLRTTRCRYFVFDIPPALHLSQWYLTTLFRERRAFRFRRFEAFEEIESELSQSDIAFFTPNQLAKFPPGYFDVFATVSSLHEMRRDQIAHYMTLMARATKSTLYLKQQKGYVNPVDGLIIGKDDYPAPDGWSVRRERFDLINPGFFERAYGREAVRRTAAGAPDKPR